MPKNLPECLPPGQSAPPPLLSPSALTMRQGRPGCKSVPDTEQRVQALEGVSHEAAGDTGGQTHWTVRRQDPSFRQKGKGKPEKR